MWGCLVRKTDMKIHISCLPCPIYWWDIISKEGVSLDRLRVTILEGFIKEGVLKNRQKFSLWKENRGVLDEGILVCLEDSHSVRMEIRLQAGEKQEVSQEIGRSQLTRHRLSVGSKSKEGLVSYWGMCTRTSYQRSWRIFLWRTRE